MTDDDNRGKNRAAQLRELIEQMKGRAAPPATGPASPRKESLREAVHRRARELRALRKDTQEEPPSNDGTN